MDGTTDKATTGPAKAPGKRRRWLRRGAIGVGVALILFTVVGFLVVPPVARRVAQTQLGTLLGRKVAIERIRLNPFALSLAIEGFHIFESDGNTPFVEFKRFYVNAQLSSVYRRAPVIQEVSLDGLRIHVERRTATAGGWGDLTTYNFSDVLARLNAGPPAPPSPPAPADAAPPRFSVNNIRLTDGRVVFEDRPLGARHEVSDLSFGIPFVSTLPVFIDSFVEPGLSVRVDGTPFVAQGRSKPFKDSLETTLELRLDALDLTRYVPFVPMDLPFAVDSARLTVALDLAFVRPRVDAPTLSLKGRVALSDLDVREKRGPKAATLPLLKLGQLELVIADANLTSQHLHLSHVRLTALEVHARRQRNGVLNLQQMVPRAPATDSPPPARTAPVAKVSKPARAAAPPRFLVDAIDLTGIKVHLDDQTTMPAFHTTVDDTSLVVRGLSNAPGASATVEFGARAVPGGVIKQHGTLVLEPHLHAKGNLTIEGIEPGRFAPYYAEQIAFDIIKGQVRVGSGYDVEDGAGGMAVKLEQAFVELADFALRRRDKRDDFLRMGLVAVHGAKIDLAARQVAIAEIALTEGKLHAERDEKGVVDLSTLVGSPSPPPSKAPLKPAPTPSPATSEAAGPAWVVTVAKLDIDKWGVRFDDRAVQPRAQLSVDPLSLHFTDISTVPGARMGVNLRMGLNRTGTLTVTGTGGYQPIAANLRYDLKGLEIVPFQPYFKDQVSLDVTGGALSLKGQANVEVPAAPAHGGAARPPKANLETDLEIAGFASVDRARQESLVQWKSFRVTGVKLGTTPMAVRVGEIDLDDLQARVALLADGGTNLAHAFAPPTTTKAKTPVPPPAAPKGTPDEKPPQVDVGQVVIQRGAVLVSDRTVQPNVSTEITDFGGRISGLSTTADTQANIDLHAAINRVGSLSVTGQANPLAKELFADVKVDIKDVDLPPASPYAGRYVGFVVEKGKLGVSLAYHVANRKLEASNRLVLDQFTFGGKTDSAEAVKVPVRLAVAILKDRHGVIDLELPIAGSLDDPEFKVGRLILKVLGNLVVKAVTAPFSYIASAFGGGDELSRLDFAPGSLALEPKTQQKLTSLTKALTERPGLSFEVEGIADPKRDRESVRRQVLERLLAAERVAELQAEAGDGGKVVPAIDNVRVAVADRPRLLEKLYKAKVAAKPPAGADPSKPASPAELEKVLFEHVTVSDDELRALALRRATLVQATLTKAVTGAGARLFLLKPRLDAAGARVDFHLKQD